MKKFFLSGILVFFSCSFVSLFSLQKELGAFRHSLTSLTQVLQKSPIDTHQPPEPPEPPIHKEPEAPKIIKIDWPKFYAAYTYKLLDEKGIPFTTSGKELIYKVGIRDSGYIRVKNNTTGIERVIEKDKEEPNEIKVGETIYTIIAAGPELTEGAAVKDFTTKKIQITKQKIVFGINTPVSEDEVHVVYPVDKLAYKKLNHEIDPFKMQEIVLQDAAKREVILQLLQNDMHFVTDQEAQITKNIPSDVEAAKKINHNLIREYLKKLEQQLTIIFDKYKEKKEYDPKKYEKDFSVIKQFNALFSLIHKVVIDPLAARNRTFEYLWKTSEYSNIHEVISKFIIAINSQYNSIKNDLEQQLHTFKEQLLKAKNDKTLSALPIELFKEKEPTVSTETSEETEELLDLEAELLQEYKNYKKLSHEKQREYRENEDNQDVKEQLEKYKKLAGSLDVGQSGRNLLEWLRVWQED